jgi:K+-transporting ATPase ATPase C chain
MDIRRDDVFAQLRSAVVVFVLLTLLTGVAYPLLIWGVGQAAFPYQANGSVIVRSDERLGSELIGQFFDQPRYFWGRPSATDPPYNSAASSGSNLGPTNPVLLKAVENRIDTIRKAHADQQNKPVPTDLVTASASGLDPHISPEAAVYQVTRVARARNWNEERVRQLVAEHTEGRTLDVLGEPRVNVLKLNLALDGKW